jgi:uncharacterized protein (UPF0264 family)
VRLLVSVSNGEDAEAALRGGADIIDAKDPARGALGAVERAAFHDIRLTCSDRVPVTAALGDRGPAAFFERQAQAFAAAGASLVKIGFSKAVSRPEIEHLLRAAVRGAAAAPVPAGVIAVAYADWKQVSSAVPDDVLSAAVSAGVAGILFDTADKDGPGLSRLISPGQLDRWIGQAHDAALLVAVAGRLSADDFDWLVPLGADIAGVRGAACDAGRASRISAARVTMLRERCVTASRPGARSTAPVAAAQT